MVLSKFAFQFVTIKLTITKFIRLTLTLDYDYYGCRAVVGKPNSEARLVCFGLLRDIIPAYLNSFNLNLTSRRAYSYPTRIINGFLKTFFIIKTKSCHTFRTY